MHRLFALLVITSGPGLGETFDDGAWVIETCKKYKTAPQDAEPKDCKPSGVGFVSDGDRRHEWLLFGVAKKRVGICASASACYQHNAALVLRFRRAPSAMALTTQKKFRTWAENELASADRWVTGTFIDRSVKNRRLTGVISDSAQGDEGVGRLYKADKTALQQDGWYVGWRGGRVRGLDKVNWDARVEAFYRPKAHSGDPLILVGRSFSISTSEAALKLPKAGLGDATGDPVFAPPIYRAYRYWSRSNLTKATVGTTPF